MSRIISIREDVVKQIEPLRIKWGSEKNPAPYTVVIKKLMKKAGYWKSEEE